VKDAEYFITDIAPNDTIWAIDDGTGLVGVIGVKPDLGYWLRSDLHGRGYMTQAADAAIAWYFSQTDADLPSGHFPDNNGSRGILLKMGFIDTKLGHVLQASTGKVVQLQHMAVSAGAWQSNRFYLETGRTVMRAFAPTDTPKLAQIGNDPCVARMLMSVTLPWSHEQAQTWVERAVYRGSPGFRVGIYDFDGGLLGMVGIGPLLPNKAPSLMYFLDQEHWGQGFATEAVGAFIAECYTRFDLDRIEAGYFIENPASGRVLEKLGFIPMYDTVGTSAARDTPVPERIMGRDRDA
jgi:RimJ/RimL family protein N-acetyltransferase